MSTVISDAEPKVGQVPDNDLAIVRAPSANSGSSASVSCECAVPSRTALPIGAPIASNPPGDRPSCFKVLGNAQLGFQVWLSRDGLTWLSFGQAYATYDEMATAFAGSYRRPATVLDPVIAAAYDAQEAAPDTTRSSDGQPDTASAA